MPDAPGNARSERPDYGVDAPGVVRNLFIVAVAGIALFLAARLGFWSGSVGRVDVASSVVWPGVACGLMGIWMLYDSKVGKLKSAESLLDLWHAEDLTGNAPEATMENARREGVADRVEVATGDMRKMPFPEARFDIVVSNVAIHNVYEREGRDQAIREIARVLKPGGRVVIHDIRHVTRYAASLAASGLVDVRRVGSAPARLALLVATFGSLRPDTVVARKAEG
jgi:arsenite methyltransferase